MFQQINQEWFIDARSNTLSGITVTLALIPDALAFSFIAGVNPMIGLYTTIFMAIVTSFFGGRPGMLSSSAGSMSVLMTALVARHGLEYLFAATILTGVFQWVMGALKLGKLINFVPHPVITGFVNSLAILVFTAQLKNFVGQSWPMYAIVAATLAIIYLFPKITKAIPSPLVAVVAMTLVCLVWNIHIPTVGSTAHIVNTFPSFHLPHIPWTLQTLALVWPYSLSLAVVGYTETLLTQTVIDEMTDEKTDKNVEMKGQGLANIVSGFFGGMAGCALIAESFMNVQLGGRKRLSTLVAALFLLALVLVLGNVLTLIPMAALVGVMMMISIAIFDWKSIRNIHRIPKLDAVIMLTTVVIVMATHDLAIGVVIGILISTVSFAYTASKVHIHSEIAGIEKVYYVEGHLFFVSAPHLFDQMDFANSPAKVCLDLSKAHVWDHTAKLMIEKIINKFTDNGISLRIIKGPSSITSHPTEQVSAPSA